MSFARYLQGMKGTYAAKIILFQPQSRDQLVRHHPRHSLRVGVHTDVWLFSSRLLPRSVSRGFQVLLLDRDCIASGLVLLLLCELCRCRRLFWKCIDGALVRFYGVGIEIKGLS